MDDEQKAALRGALELIKEVSVMAEQAEGGLLDLNRELPPDLMERLEEVREKIAQYDENDRKLRDQLGIDDNLYTKMLAPRKELPTPKKKVIDRTRALISDLRERAYKNRLAAQYGELVAKNPKFKLDLPEVREAPIQKATSEELAKKDSSSETTDQKRRRLREAKAEGKKKYRKVGGFRNWKKL